MTKKLIKTSLATLLLFSLFLSNIVSVSAASFSISSSVSSVSSNGSFTVYISVNGAGRFNISGNNASVSLTSIWCENSCSVNATAGSSGTASVSVTASDVTGFDETPVTGTKTVSVGINQKVQPTVPDNANENKPSNKPVEEQTKEEKKNISLLLKSLTVDGISLSPEFKSNIKDYSIKIPYGQNKIKVTADKEDNDASIEGTGEIDIKDKNAITISVINPITNEKNDYVISLDKEKEPSLKVIGLDGTTKVSVIEFYDNAPELKGFEDFKLKIEDKELTVKKQKETGDILLFILDENGKSNYYIYSETEKKLMSIYIPITINSRYYGIISIPSTEQSLNGFSYNVLTIDKIEFNGFKFNDKQFADYFLIYLMDENGNKNYYLYDSVEQTVQRYSKQAPITQKEYNELIEKLENQNKMIQIYLIGLGIVCFILLITTIIIVVKVNKKNTKIRTSIPNNIIPEENEEFDDNSDETEMDEEISCDTDEYPSFNLSDNDEV